MKQSDLMKLRIATREKYQKVLAIAGELNDLMLKEDPSEDFHKVSEKYGDIFNAALIITAALKFGVELWEAKIPQDYKWGFLEAFAEHCNDPEMFLMKPKITKKNKAVAIVVKDGKMQPMTSEELKGLFAEIESKMAEDQKPSRPEKKDEMVI